MAEVALLSGQWDWGTNGDQSWSLKSEITSNFRELYNLVLALERASDDGLLKGCKVFMFTDNTVAERAFYKGSSKSRRLFDLVLSLRKLEMSCGGWFHIIHVAGTWMIECGVDSLSRGDQTTGIMQGELTLAHAELHRGALERAPQGLLLSWLRSWLEVRSELKILEPADRFRPFEQRGTY